MNASRKNDRTRTRLRAAGAAALLVGALLVAPASASADEDVEPFSLGQCSANHLCLWSATGYTGAFWQTISTSVVNVSGMTTAKSLWNRSSHAARIYSGTGGSGSSVCVNPGTQTASTTIPAQSARILPGTAC